MGMDQYSQKIMFANGQLEEEQNYWRKKLEGDVLISTFPSKSNVLQNYTNDKAILRHKFDYKMYEKLCSMCKNSQYAMFMMLSACFKYLLYRYSGNEDVIVGMPALKTENSTSSLKDALLLRTYIDEEKSFKELLADVKNTIIEGDKFSNIPFWKVSEMLKLEASEENRPYIKTIVMLDSIHDMVTLNNIVTDNIFCFSTVENCLELKVHYNLYRYEEAVIKTAVNQLDNILAAIVQNPNIKLSEIDILSEDDINKQLYTFNDTKAEYPDTKVLHKLFEEQVQKTPDNIALAFEGSTMSYSQLNQKANQLARKLRSFGVSADTLVGIITERSFEMIIGMFAVLKAGGAYLPIDPDYPKDRIHYMINDSKVSILLTQNNEVIKEDEREIIQINLKDKSIFDGDISNLENENKPSDLAYIIYTSGTTGNAKGAMLEHRNVVRLMFNNKMKFDFNQNDIWTMFHSFCFDFSVWEIYGALLYGGKLVIVPKFTAQDPVEFLNLVKEHKVTVLNQTPTAFYSFINEELKTLDKELALRYVIFGGEALKPVMLKNWRNKYPKVQLINMYGITETTVHVTYKEITETEIELNMCNIGKPIPTLNTYIMDKSSRLLPIGAVGELCVGGAGVCRGYLNRAELTEQKFIMNPYIAGERIYKSGDLARLLSNGELEYFGRIDHQVKIRGHRVELGEIEAAMLKYSSVKEVVALATEDENNNLYICAYFVADKHISISEFREHLSKLLPGYMLPAYFIQLSQIPMTSNNKVDRKKLLELKTEVKDDEAYEAPRNEIEKKLVKIWEEVLNLKDVSINGNFFSLGGDSIKAITLISRMNKAIEAKLQIKDIYIEQTIKEIYDKLIKDNSQEIEDELTKGLEIIQNIKNTILADEKNAIRLSGDIEDFYPLSAIQQGMVFFTKLMPDEPIYHDQFPYVVSLENFDIEIFNQSMRMLMERHSILRTTFSLEDFGKQLQIVHTMSSSIIPYIIIEDLSAFDKSEQKAKVTEYMKLDLENKFKFDNSLLWRLKVFKLEKQEFCFVLSFQHAVLDGWSVANLIKELFDDFGKRLSGEKTEVSKIKTSYKDYVALSLSRNTSAAVYDFWKENLKGYSRNKLPFNISNKKINDINGSRIFRRKLALELLNSLEKKTKEYSCSFKDICMAAYVYLMGILTTEQDIVTGVVTHERPALEDSEKVLGCFLNTLPVRVKVEGIMKKSELLTSVKNALKASKANELFLADIAAIIGESGGLGNPIFDTLMNYTDFHVMKSVEQTKSVTIIDNNTEFAANEMTNTLFDLEVSKTLDVLILQIKYSPNYFYAEDINTVADLYEAILGEIAFGDDEYLISENLISEKQKEEIIYGFNNTRAEYSKEKTMHGLFEEQAERTPNNIALILNGREMTYRELNEKANQFARLLAEKGVKSGDHVALITERNFEMIAAMLGILKCGGAYVPIDPEYPAARKEYIVENSKISTIVIDKQYDFVFGNQVVIDFSAIEKYPSVNLNIEKDSRDLAYVIYTSGSTGRPKGVMIEHHSAVNLISWVNKEFEVNERDNLLFITSMCFDLSVYDIFGTLSAGATVVIGRKEQVQEPEKLKQLLVENKITFWDSVPSTMNYIVNSMEENEDEFIQKDLRLVFMSGDWIPVALPQRLKKFFPNARPISLGGATEGTVWSIYYPIEKQNKNSTSIPYGRPIDNNYFYILDSNMKLVPKGVAGELYIGGVGVARGYMNDAEKTKKSFMWNRFLSSPEERMYKTGDFGRMLPDGQIEFLGRIDHQVKIRGYRVELGEIENRLLMHESVKEAAVADIKDSRGDKYLCAYIVWHEEVSAVEMREYLSKQLPDYMIPAHFVSIEYLPLTTNGKLDRKALPDPDADLSIGEEYVAPRNEIEEKLAHIWSEVLGVSRIGIDDDFFTLGGHSLKAIQAIAMIHKDLEVEVPVGQVFGNSTIRLLGEFIKKVAKNKFSHIKAVEVREYYPASYSQRRMYILNALKPFNTSYNIPEILRIQGKLDINKVEAAMYKLILRHEALRTSFQFIDGQIYQKIEEEPLFKISFFRSKENDLDNIIENFISPFNLEVSPLIRLQIVILSEDSYVMMFDLHHIITDGVSSQILIEEFIELYEGKVLEALKIQYKDYAVWENELFQSGEMERQKAFWMNMFKDGTTKLSMPLDYLRPANQTMNGKSFAFEVHKVIVSKMNSIAVKEHTTLNILLISAFNLLLSQYSGQEEITIGLTIAGRNHSDFERIVGTFINFLPIKSSIKRGNTFMELLQAEKKLITEAYNNQNYPFDEIVANVLKEKDNSRNPLFDCMFKLHNQFDNNKEFKLEDLVFSEVKLDRSTSKLDFIIDAAVDSEGKLLCSLEYNTDLFKEETMQQFSKHFQLLLSKIAEKSDNKLAALNVLTETELKEIEVRRENSLSAGSGLIYKDELINKNGFTNNSALTSINAEAVETTNMTANKTELEVVVASTFTDELLGKYISWWGKQFDQKIRMQFAPYNQVFQQLLDNNSLVSNNSSGINVILVRFEDWIRDVKVNEDKCKVMRNSFKSLISALDNQSIYSTYLVGVFPISAHLKLTNEEVECIKELNDRLKEFLLNKENLYLLDFSKLDKLYSINEVFNVITDRAGHIPFTDEYYAAMGTFIARKIRAIRKQAFKVIALDCDNTLWKGICGEAGALGVEVQASFKELQSFLLQKYNEGMLLVLCSKNNEADVWEVFEKNPDMLLKKGNIVGWKINWNRKSENLRELAGELNLGLDSFIFLDDSSVECSEVMTYCPEVLTLQLPADTEAIPKYLKHVWAFDKEKVTREDRERNSMYVAEKSRKELVNNKVSIEEFLESLELKMSMNPIEDGEVKRVSQLTQRTNQFNLSTIRRTEEEIAEISKNKNMRCWVVEVEDKFGSYGIVGTVITERREDSLFIDSFMLSCRAMGRKVEEAMLSCLGRYCRSEKLSKLEAKFYPTAKNKPCEEFIKSWTEAGRTEEYIAYELKSEDVAESVAFVDCYYNSRYEKKAEITSAEGRYVNKENNVKDLQADGNIQINNSCETVEWDVPMVNKEKLLHLNDLTALSCYTGERLLMLSIAEDKLIEKSNIASNKDIVRGKAFAAATNEIEDKLVRLWSEVLGVNIVGIDDDFFALGGHSLKAIQLISLLYKELNVEIPLGEMFNNPTIRQLGKLLEKSKRNIYSSIKAAEVREYYPVSYSQRRMYILNALNPGNTNYNIPTILKVEGQLDTAKVETAMNKLILRHEALRTSFHFVNGDIVQKIAEKAELRINYIQGNERDLDKIIKNYIKPFKLDESPLVRLQIVTLSESSYVMMFDIHHIITDGVSTQILIEEFVSLYTENELPELKIQYKDYAIWEEELFKSSEMEKQKNFWMDMFKDGPTKLDMPLDYLRPENQTMNGSTITFNLDKTIVAKMNNIAIQEHTTLNIVLFSVYNLLLSQYSGQEDITVGLTIAGRNHPDLERIVGTFINFLPIKTRIKTSSTFMEFLKVEKDLVTEAYNNQNYPFDEIVSRVVKEHDNSRNPLFDCMFKLHNQFDSKKNFKVDDLVFSDIQLDLNTSKLDFMIDAILDNEGNLICSLEYNTDLFREETMKQFGSHYSQLLSKIANNPKNIINELNVLSETELISIEAARKNISREVNENQTVAKNELDIVVTSTFTDQVIENHIVWWNEQFGEKTNVKFAPYNQVFQQLLDKNSLLSTNKGINIVLVRFEDWIRDVKAEEQEKCRMLKESFDRFISVLENQNAYGTYLVGVFPISTHLLLSSEVRECLIEFNNRLKELLNNKENLHLLDFSNLDKLYSIKQVFNEITDRAGHMPFTDEYYAAMGTFIARKIRAIRKQAFKVIALDCDNTLWKGICGEAGALGVEVQAAFKELQSFLLQKYNEGMLLVLCSKNNEADVWEVFEKNTDMLLKKENIVDWKINWNRKSENLRELAAELNLGLDSFIFLDDSSVECSEVMTNCPEVLTLQLPSDTKAIPKYLKHVWAFDKEKVTREDRERNSMYVAEKSRKELVNNKVSIEDFLESLELKMSMNPIEDGEVKRVSQLTQRTNQFNLSTIRRTEEEIAEISINKNMRCWGVEVEDKFGSYGIVGTVITEKRKDSLFIDSFMLSCRAMGRKVEEAMLSCLGRYCRSEKLSKLEAKFYPTAKNKPCEEFIKTWTEVGRTEEYIEYELKAEDITESVAFVDCYYNSRYEKKAEIASIDENRAGKTNKINNIQADNIGENNKTTFIRTDDNSKNSISEDNWDVLIVNKEKLVHLIQLKALSCYTGEKLLKLPINKQKVVERLNIEAKYAAPRNETEEKLVSIWSEVLGVDKIGIDDDFFSLGGHSLKAIKLEVKLEEIGLHLEFSEIYKYNTVRKLADYFNGFENALTNEEAAVESIKAKDIEVIEQEDIISDGITLTNVEPFNEVFFKSCYYNSFFPVLRHYNKDDLSILVNDVIVYSNSQNNEAIIDIDYLSDKPIEQVVGEVGIKHMVKLKSENLIEDIIKALDENRCVIIWVDCYYSSMRKDTYKKKHLEHTLLIYGYSKTNEHFNIIEHLDADSLTYGKHTIKFEELIAAYEGYLNNYSSNAMPTYFEFFSDADEQIEKLDNRIYLQRYLLNLENRKEAYTSQLYVLKAFIDKFSVIFTGENELLMQNAQTLLVGLNHIINAKQVEKYKILKLFNNDFQGVKIIEEILDNWVILRSIVAKYIITSSFRQASFQAAVKRLEKIYELEGEYRDKLLCIELHENKNN